LLLDGRIILMCIWRNKLWKYELGSTGTEMRAAAGSCERNSETLRFYKMREVFLNSWPTVSLSTRTLNYVVRSEKWLAGKLSHSSWIIAVSGIEVRSFLAPNCSLTPLWLTNYLTPWNRVLPKEAPVAQLLKNYRTFLWNPKVHCCFHTNTPLVPTRNQINPVYISPSDLSKIHFNIILVPLSKSS
jgi:hypothetical protein